MRKASLLRIASVGSAMVVGLLLAHCGGDDSTALSDDQDTGTLEETGDDVSTSEASTDETASETSADETGADETGDAGESEAGDADVADAGCGPLSATALDVYVDKASTKPSVGTTECPFHTIREATDLAAVSGRTIHVKGGTTAAPADYTESGPIVVKSGVTLAGDGLTVTKITNAATCTGGSTCAVEVQNGGTFGAFTVTGSGNGIVTGPGDSPAFLKNLRVTGAQDGVLALGTVKLAGGVQLDGNKLSGLHANATTAGRTVTVSGTLNLFDGNEGKGIFVEGSSRLDAMNGSASDNKGGGIYLASTVAAGTPHLVTDFFVNDNQADGVNVGGTSSLKLRGTAMQANGHHGLSFTFSVSNVLDIGKSGSLGGNTFSSATEAKKNGAAGLCLQNSGATNSQPAEGNKWAACALVPPPVAQTAITSGECATFSGTKVEIAYKKAASGGNNPVQISGLGGCSTAP